MTTFGIDHAWGRPSIASLKAAKVKFVIRYLSHDTAGKNLSRSEADRLANAGIWLAVIWESSANRAATGGRSGGVADATRAQAQADSCGMPSGRPIYFAVDFDASGVNWSKIVEYFKGVASVIGLERVGMYAGHFPIRWAFNEGLISYGWQTIAWSQGLFDIRCHLFQYAIEQTIDGVDCDFNEAYRADFGQWMPGKVPAAPEPPAAPPFPGRVITQPPIMRGADVKTWQIQMKKRGWRIETDGEFGPASERVLRLFQEEKGMMVDGELGPKSWRAAWTAPR